MEVMWVLVSRSFGEDVEDDEAKRMLKYLRVFVERGKLGRRLNGVGWREEDNLIVYIFKWNGI